MANLSRSPHHEARSRAAGLLLPLLTAVLAASPGPSRAYHDGAGKEWRQPASLLGVGRLTRDQITAQCPTDGAQACQGALAGVDMKDWVWATEPQVRQLFGRYAAAMLEPGLSSVLAPPGSFFTDFTPTFDQLVGGCGSYAGCWRVTLVTGITADLALPGGVPTTQVGEVGQGSFFIGPRAGGNPAGLWMWRPTGHGTTQVHAYDDAGRLNAPGAGVAHPNVLGNDWVGGVRATTANVVLTQLSSDLAGIWLDIATGSVHAAAGVAPGVWKLDYRICNAAAATQCDDAQVSVTVPAFAISAAADSGSIGYGTGGLAIANVLSNDRLGGVAPTVAMVHLTQVSTTHAGISLEPGSGAVRVAAGTPHGTHQLVYRICDRAVPSSCAQATATVTPTHIQANPDSGRGSSKYANTPIASVLANDLYGNTRPTSATVILSTVGSWPAGISLNLDTGAVSILRKISSNTYTLRYRICERSSPGNCSEANVSLYTSGGL